MDIPIFRNHLEDEDDKPYFTMNSLAYYYEDMERKQKLITDMSKLILSYDTRLDVTLADMEQKVGAELQKWDSKVEELPETVNGLLTQWADDGTLNHVIDSTIVDQKLVPLTTLMTQKVGKDEPGAITWAMTAQDVRTNITGGNTAVVGVDAVLEENVVNGAITPKKTNFFNEHGKNRFNIASIRKGFFINQSDGSEVANASHDSSGYIPIKKGVVIISSVYDLAQYGLRYALYGENRNYLSGGITSGASPWTKDLKTNRFYLALTVAADGFLKFSVSPAGGITNGKIMVSHESDLAFENFNLTYKLKSDSLPTPIVAFLPAEICVAAGRTIEIYNKQVCPLADRYHFKWTCSKGKAYKRKFSIEGKNTDIGGYDLKLTIYDDFFNVVWERTTLLKIVEPITTAMTMVNIGDSLTNTKPWLSEMINLNNNITMKGTRPFTIADSSPAIRSGFMEGRSGFRAVDYLTAATYENEGIHPFWDGTRFNWNHYVTNSLGGVSPNAVHILLGTNGLAIDPTVNANNIKQIVDYIRQDNPSMPIYLSFTLYNSNQDGIGKMTANGVYKYEQDMKVFNLMNRLYSLFNGYANLFFVPMALCHDSEYNFGATQVPVNPRSKIMESIPDEYIHPQYPGGYYQMADILFSVVSAHKPV